MGLGEEEKDARKRRVEKDAKLVVNLKREKLSEEERGRERLREEKEDVNQ